MKTKGLLLFAFLLVFFLNSQAADNVSGNGKVTTKSILIDDFNEIKIDELMDFCYEQSDDDSNLEITLDENLHQYIKIDIQDRVLSVGFDKKVNINKLTQFAVKANSKWLKKVKVSGNANFMVNDSLKGDELEVKANDNSLVQFKQKLHVGSLNLEVSGSANMVVDDLTADKLNCIMNGSGSIRLKAGKANAGNFSTASSGDIHALGVAIPDVKCKMMGNGLTEIHPTGSLNATLMGKGTIRYKGPADVKQRILGKGTIEEIKE